MVIFSLLIPHYLTYNNGNFYNTKHLQSRCELFVAYTVTKEIHYTVYKVCEKVHFYAQILLA